ncbi:MAG: GumC family protein [Bryobacteraceae bacterium]
MQTSRKLLPEAGRTLIPVSRPEPPVAPHGWHAAGAPETDRLVDYLGILRRRKLALTLAILLGGSAAAGLSLLQTPSYRATASIEVEGLNENFLNLKDVYATANPTPASPEAPVNTEAAWLKEESLIRQVVQTLGLTHHREYQPQKGLLETLGVRGSAQAGPREPETEAVGVVKANLDVEAPRQGRIIRIHYESKDPNLAAQVPNTLAATLIQNRLETRWKATEKIAEWLDPQLVRLKSDLTRSEEQLQNYARNQGLLFTGGLESTGEQNLRLLQAELARSRTDRIQRQSRLEAAVLGRPELAAAGDETRVLQDNRVKLTDLRRELAELSAVLKPENYRVRRVQAQIQELEAAQQEEEERIRQRIEREYAAARTHEQLLERAYQQQAELVSEQGIKTSVYENLKREVEVNRRVYESMMQKAREAGIASAIQPSNIRMVTAARPPLHPFKPNLPLNLGVGLFVGVALGVVYVVASEQGDRTLRKPGQVEQSLHLPELGAIPRAGRRIVRSIGGSSRTLEGVEVATRMHRMSAFSESFRATLTSLLYSNGAAPPAAIVVTSALPAEGKTTVACNLALALTEISRRVLLVDADMRAPRLHELFSVENDRGLSDLLSASSPVEASSAQSLIRSTEVPGLWVLPSGPGVEQSSPLLQAARMEEVLPLLRRHFDNVIVDAPPSLLFADARILARAADGVVLVVRANRTSLESVASAAQRLQSENIPILGTILNDWNPGAQQDPYGYRQLHKYYSKG